MLTVLIYTILNISVPPRLTEKMNLCRVDWQDITFSPFSGFSVTSSKEILMAKRDLHVAMSI